MASIFILFEKIFGREFPFHIIANLWMIAILVTAIRFSYWKCPRCNKRYFIKNFMAHQFTKKCMHCGLHKYEGMD